MLLSAEQAAALGPPGPDLALAQCYAEHITEMLVPLVAPHHRVLHCRVPPELSYPVASALADAGYEVTTLRQIKGYSGRLEIKWDPPSAAGALSPGRLSWRTQSPVFTRTDLTMPNVWYHRLGILLGLVEADNYVTVRLCGT